MTEQLTEWECRVPAGSPLALCGAGNLCAHLLRTFPYGEIDGHVIQAIADNDTDKHGEECYGHAICSMQDAACLPDVFYIILINAGYLAVRNQLICLGVPEYRIIHWWTLWQHFSQLKNEDWSDVPAPGKGWLEDWKDALSVQTLVNAYDFYKRYSDQTVPFEFCYHYSDPKSIYFDRSIYKPARREVLLDCGAFTGDTLDAFAQAYADRQCKAIAIEPDPDNFAQLVNNWDEAEAVVLVNAALVADPSIKSVSFGGTGVSARVGAGAKTVPATTIDEICKDITPTLIKCDIEGFELNALRGGEQTIRRCRPVLAICLYHRPSDLWDIPAYARMICDDYLWFVRCYSEGLAWETVMYAVPYERVKPRPEYEH